MAGTGSIRHTVLIKLKDKADTQKVADDLRSLQNGLPGVTWLSFNLVTDLGNPHSLHVAGLVESNADVSLTVDFADQENLVAYAKHPQHLSLISANKDLVANRLSIQYSPPAKL